MYSLYITKSLSKDKYICPINMDCINLTKLILIRPYNLYNFISISNSNKEKLKNIRNNKDTNTIVLGYKKQFNLNDQNLNESTSDILSLYDIFIMKYDIDQDDIIGFDIDEINYILEGTLIRDCINNLV